MQMMHRYGFRIQTKSPARRFGDIRVTVTNRRLGINQTVEGRSYRLAMLAAAVGGVAEFGYLSLLPAYAVEAGASTSTSLRLLTVLLVGGICLQVLVGWLPTRAFGWILARDFHRLGRVLSREASAAQRRHGAHHDGAPEPDAAELFAIADAGRAAPAE